MEKTHPCNVASSGSNAANCHPDTSGRLRNEGALLQGVIDPLNTVILHSKQEAARHSTKQNCLNYTLCIDFSQHQTALEKKHWF